MAVSACRVKVVVENTMPFWMIVDCQECPHIRDIEEKISTIKGISVDSLLVDDCLLPSCERSTILRENDEVHVKIQSYSFSDKLLLDEESGSSAKSQKKKKKRKHKERDGADTDISEGNESKSSRSKENSSGKLDESETRSGSSPVKNKRSSSNKETVKEAINLNRSDVHGKGSPSRSDEPSLCHQEAKHACATDQTTRHESATENLSNNYSSHEGKETGGVVNGSNVTDRISESVSSSKRKRKRKRSKRRESCPEKGTPLDAGGQITQWNPPAATPPDLRLPKWQQPKSKKIVFTSSDEETVAVEENVQKEPKTLEGKTSNANYINSKGYFDSAQTVAEAEQDTSSMALEAGDARIGSKNGWRTDQQCKRYSENDAKVQPVATFEKSGASNLAEFLRMSPEERGVILQPFMKSERLPNGAMMYTRVSPPKGYQSVQKSWSQHTSSPHQLSKEEQLATVATNRSIVIQNTCSKSKTGVDNQQTSTPAAPENTGTSVEPNTSTNEASPAHILAEPLYRDYTRFPDLTYAPKVGDLIAYKVLELGEDYTPGESDYKEAEVLCYDSKSKSVTVKLIVTGLEQKKRKPGRFDMPGDGSMEEEDTVMVELASMLAAKILTAPS